MSYHRGFKDPFDCEYHGAASCLTFGSLRLPHSLYLCVVNHALAGNRHVRLVGTSELSKVIRTICWVNI